jgi:hypothetical protein
MCVLYCRYWLIAAGLGHNYWALPVSFKSSAAAVLPVF